VPGVEPLGARDNAVGAVLVSETLVADPSASIFSISSDWYLSASEISPPSVPLQPVYFLSLL